MNCERCGKDTTLHNYEVDGFTGYLCEGCAETWDEITTE
jgi:transposase-like protein